MICLSLDSVFVFLFSQTFIKHTLASAAQCDGASVGGMEARYLGYRIKFGWGGVGGVALGCVSTNVLHAS